MDKKIKSIGKTIKSAEKKVGKLLVQDKKEDRHKAQLQHKVKTMKAC